MGGRDCGEKTYVSNPPHQLLLQERHDITRAQALQLTRLNVVQQNRLDCSCASHSVSMFLLKRAVIARLTRCAEDMRSSGKNAGRLPLDGVGRDFAAGSEEEEDGEGTIESSPVGARS